jgi:hypothetical protein
VNGEERAVVSEAPGVEAVVVSAILETMKSKLAEQLKSEQRERFARMTPAERLALSERLGEEGLAEFMSANRLARVEAVRMIQQSRRIGRRPSACLDERH